MLLTARLFTEKVVPAMGVPAPVGTAAVWSTTYSYPVVPVIAFQLNVAFGAATPVATRPVGVGQGGAGGTTVPIKKPTWGKRACVLLDVDAVVPNIDLAVVTVLDCSNPNPGE